MAPTRFSTPASYNPTDLLSSLANVRRRIRLTQTLTEERRSAMQHGVDPANQLYFQNVDTDILERKLARIKAMKEAMRVQEEAQRNEIEQWNGLPMLRRLHGVLRRCLQWVFGQMTLAAEEQE
ncbi:MAG: hypothetical protein Q9217_001367 [Psora testacea]